MSVCEKQEPGRESELTVKLASRIFSVNQSTFRFVLQKMTAWVMVRVS